MIAKKIQQRIGKIDGKLGVYYYDVKTGNSCNVGNEDVFVPAGIEQLPILIETFRQIEEGIIHKNDIYILKEEDKMPSLGVLNIIHSGTKLHIEDIYKMMICIGDNSATNILINLLGMEDINNTMEVMGFRNTRINRLFFDSEKEIMGIQNQFSLSEMGELLRRMYFRQVISNGSSEQILSILQRQQRNAIIPYYFGEELPISHVVGEDPGILHNIGIVFSKNPFILCMGGNGVDTRSVEGIMRDVSLICYNESNK